MPTRRHPFGLPPARALRPSGNAAPVPGAFVFYAKQDPGTQADAATAAEIETALRGVQTTANTAASAGTALGLGNWVGPRARITRTTQMALTGGRPVTVAWLFQFPDDSTADANGAARDANRQSLLLTQAQARLAAIAGAHGQDWSGFTLLPYDPSANGSVAWWQNGGAGGAGDTRTRDAYDLNQQLGATASIENPTGPNQSAPTNLANPVAGATGLLATGALVVGGGVALWYAWPTLARLRG